MGTSVMAGDRGGRDGRIDLAGTAWDLVYTDSQVRSISNWSPYDRVGVVDADP